MVQVLGSFRSVLLIGLLIEVVVTVNGAVAAVASN